MAKSKSNIEKIKIGITTTPRIVKFIDLLAETEIYGTTRAEVVENLVRVTMKSFLDTDELNNLNKEL